MKASNFFLSVMWLCAMSIGMPSRAADPPPGRSAIEKVGGNRTKLKTFADPEGKVPGEDVPVASLSFPMEVLDRSNGFLRVKIGNDFVWVNQVHVTEKAMLDVTCLTAAPTSKHAVAVTRGANTGCKSGPPK